MTQSSDTPIENSVVIAGRTLPEWQEHARRDDCLDRMAPSDLRQILGALASLTPKPDTKQVDRKGLVVDEGETVDFNSHGKGFTHSPRPDAADRGMGGDTVVAAEWLWASLPTVRKWTSLKTYEKAMVCHAVKRFTALSETTPSEAVEARPLDEWHEDMGDVVWWKFPIEEAGFIGHPLDSAWPGYHTHWTPHPPIPQLTKESGNG